MCRFQMNSVFKQFLCCDEKEIISLVNYNISKYSETRASYKKADTVNTCLDRNPLQLSPSRELNERFEQVVQANGPNEYSNQ